jgi:hypothetical protein
MFNQPPHPSLQVIKPQTDAVLNAACQNNGIATHPLPIPNNLSLEGDIMLGPNLLTNLCVAYSGISTQYQGGQPVGLQAAGACTTVGSVANLVYRRANGIST